MNKRQYDDGGVDDFEQHPLSKKQKRTNDDDYAGGDHHQRDQQQPPMVQQQLSNVVQQQQQQPQQQQQQTYTFDMLPVDIIQYILTFENHLMIYEQELERDTFKVKCFFGRYRSDQVHPPRIRLWNLVFCVSSTVTDLKHPNFLLLVRHAFVLSFEAQNSGLVDFVRHIEQLAPNLIQLEIAFVIQCPQLTRALFESRANCVRNGLKELQIDVKVFYTREMMSSMMMMQKKRTTKNQMKSKSKSVSQNMIMVTSSSEVKKNESGDDGDNNGEGDGDNDGDGDVMNMALGEKTEENNGDDDDDEGDNGHGERDRSEDFVALLGNTVVASNHGISSTSSSRNNESGNDMMMISLNEREEDPDDEEAEEGNEDYGANDANDANDEQLQEGQQGQGQDQQQYVIDYSIGAPLVRFNTFRHLKELTCQFRDIPFEFENHNQYLSSVMELRELVFLEMGEWCPTKSCLKQFLSQIRVRKVRLSNVAIYEMLLSSQCTPNALVLDGIEQNEHISCLELRHSEHYVLTVEEIDRLQQCWRIRNLALCISGAHVCEVFGALSRNTWIQNLQLFMDTSPSQGQPVADDSLLLLTPMRQLNRLYVRYDEITIPGLCALIQQLNLRQLILWSEQEEIKIGGEHLADFVNVCCRKQVEVFYTEYCPECDIVPPPMVYI